jgi:3-oxoacyl-[acyl-carrier protein] reductase
MKTVLIIGGSSGIGNACARLLVGEKWDVYATFYSNERHAVGPPSVHWFYLDITDESSLKDLSKQIPKIDALIICASQNKTALLENFDIKDAKSMFDTNIISQIHALAIFKKKLKRNSSVVLFSSITGKIGSKRRIAYSASRAAIYGFVKSLAADLAPRSRVNAVVPGYIATEQYRKNSTISKEEREKVILLGRLGKPEEVARLVAFLASDESSYINAQCVHIDGGVKHTAW